MVKKETFAVYSKRGKYIETVQRRPYKHGWVGYKGKIYALSKPPKDSKAKQAIYLDRDTPASLARAVKKARRPQSTAYKIEVCRTWGKYWGVFKTDAKRSIRISPREFLNKKDATTWMTKYLKR